MDMGVQEEAKMVQARFQLQDVLNVMLVVSVWFIEKYGFCRLPIMKVRLPLAATWLLSFSVHLFDEHVPLALDTGLFPTLAVMLSTALGTTTYVFVKSRRKVAVAGSSLTVQQLIWQLELAQSTELRGVTWRLPCCAQARARSRRRRAVCLIIQIQILYFQIKIVQYFNLRSLSHIIYLPMIKTTLLACLLAIACALPPQNPIIGVYTEDAEDFGQTPQAKQTYIAASYIKNLEMAGAQVVPLFYHYSTAQLDTILSKINGVFFPGGEMPIDKNNQWTSNIQYIFDYANKQNDKGNAFPIWATCLGYEAVMYLFSGRADNMTTLTRVNGQRGLPCNLTVKNSNSILLKSLSAQQYKQVTTGNGLLWFHHTWAITVKNYQQTPSINKFWKLISTSWTEDGVQFVSTVEAFNYPYFMTQYHPEKNSFEWRIDAIRTYNAISVQQKFINEFVKVARLNTNTFPQAEWTNAWIYKYHPLFTNDPDFIQVYLFDESKL